MNFVLRSTNEIEEKQKMAVMRTMEADRIGLLMNQPFIGSIIMGLDLVPVCDSRLRTACTDGMRIFVNIKFYSSLEKRFRMSVLAHEVWHTVYCHFLRKQTREHERFNYAADLEIHFLFEDERLPEFYILPHEKSWKGLSSEEVYEKLPPTFDAQTISDHIYPGDSDGMPQNSSDSDRTPSESCADKMDEFVIDPDYAPFFAPDLHERCKERLINAVQQAKRQHGYIPGAVKRLLESYLKPRISWQDLLRQFVSSCFGGKRRWLPPNRRYVSQGLYLQSRRDERLATAVVAIDTSGSTQGDLPQFFSELTSLLYSFGSYELIVIQCDAKIQHVETFDENNIPENPRWEVHGCGGTDFRPVFKYVKDQQIDPVVLVYITDGVGSAPKEAPDFPVLWLLTADGDNNLCDWGTKISFDNH